MFSCADRLGTRLKDWNTTPTVRRRYSARSAPLRLVTSTSPT
jgi:hypothetical protein